MYESCSQRGVLDTTLCDKVCQRLRQVSDFLLELASSTNKTDRHPITENKILLKVVLKYHNPTCILTILVFLFYIYEMYDVHFLFITEK